MNISIKLIHNGNEFIANCPELDINCYGSNRDEALRRIKAVISFYISSAKELGINIDSLQEIFCDEHDSRSFSSEAKQYNTTIN
jgi:predicted RNase H-like HicB family nuclease